MCGLPTDVFWRSTALFLIGSILFCGSTSGQAQTLVENFDGGFSATLGWAGDTDAFQFSEERLQLLDERAGNLGRAAVWLSAPTRDSACWHLNAELHFSPSSGNRARFWLASDKSLDSAEYATGYYLDLGGVSGDEDAFSLFYQDPTGTSPILATAPGTAAGDSLAVRIEVCRTPPGSWSLRVEDLATDTRLAGAQAASAKPLSGSFAGLDLRYTSTRNGQFYFDDLSVDTSSRSQQPIPDAGPAPPRKRFDLLLTEIMADPNPAVGLPELEYVEVYNNTDSALSVGGVMLTTSAAETLLPDTVLPPRAYVAFAKRATTDPALSALVDFPALTNSGSQLTLLSADGVLLDQVDFRPAWHSPGKADGGWSLERVDLAQPCIVGAAGWASSNSLAGGTPGKASTALEPEDPRDSLELTGLSLLDSITLLVTVNRVLERAEGSFRVSGGELAEAVEEQGFLGSYRLRLGDALTRGATLRVSLDPSAASCVQDGGVSRGGWSTGLPQKPGLGDWVVNEIMYDPLSGDGRWVELFNRSDKLLSTAAIRLARTDEAGDVQGIALAEDSLIAGPGEFVVFAAEPVLLAERYPDLPKATVLEAAVPTLGDNACLLVFSPAGELVVERVCYEKDWHNRAYANTDGVSFERIDALGPGEAASNWTSAAAGPPSGTPGRRNSQARQSVSPDESEFSLLSERMSPDGDGYEDLLEVSFAFEAPGTLVDFEVVDLLGRLIYAPRESVSAGTAGRWSWDGVSSEGSLVPVGTYVLRASFWSEGSRARTRYLPFSVLTK